MSEYEVTVYEQVTYTVIVEAEDEDAAVDLAHASIQIGDDSVTSYSEYTGYFEVESL
jgi:hypothetical protein